MRLGRRQCGFTLVELLVALVVFATMSAMAYGGLRSILTTRDHTDEAASRFTMLQNTFMFMQQDFNQALNRPVRDEFGDAEPAFAALSGNELLALTRGGVSGVESASTSLRRVEYHLRDERLHRVSWSVLDRVQESEPFALELMSGLRDVRLRFLAEEWRDAWSSEDVSAGARPLPRAVEVTLDTRRWGEVRRIFMVSP